MSTNSKPLRGQRQPSLMVSNAVELFIRQFPFDRQAHREWREWKDVCGFDYYIHIRVNTSPITGRKWKLSITHGNPEQKPRVLLNVSNDPAEPGVRYIHKYDYTEDVQIVTMLGALSLTWDESPSGVQFTL